MFVESVLMEFINRERANLIKTSLDEKMRDLVNASDIEYEVEFDQDMLEFFLRKEIAKTKTIFSCFIET